MTVRRSDTAAVLMLRMDTGAVAKSLHGGLRGHGTYTRIHGNKGLMESARALAEIAGGNFPALLREFAT